MSFFFLNLTVPVSSITLLATVISVIAGQQMNLTCETSYCNPPANITWYKSLNDITNQSTSKTYIVDGLTKTVSVLLSPVVKADNRNQIYCIANNTRNTKVSSSIRTLDVTCKYVVYSCQITFFIHKKTLDIYILIIT